MKHKVNFDEKINQQIHDFINNKLNDPKEQAINAEMIARLYENEGNPIKEKGEVAGRKIVIDYVIPEEIGKLIGYTEIEKKIDPKTGKESTLEARDVCGNGDTFSYHDPKISWWNFPVRYYYDLSHCNMDKTIAASEINKTIIYYNELFPTIDFFRYINNIFQIRLLIRFTNLPEGKLATTFWEWDSSNRISWARIDVNNTVEWFRNDVTTCGYKEGPYDLRNVLTHELGHTFFEHNKDDPFATMYDTAFPGETLKRTFTRGELKGITELYEIS